MGLRSFLTLALLLSACGSTSPAHDAAPDTRANDTAVDMATPDMATPDTSPDRSPDNTASIPGCTACGADELCLFAFDGTCLALGGSCVKKTADCQTPVCSAGCNTLCNGGMAAPIRFSCYASCPTSAQYPSALLCYGP